MSNADPRGNAHNNGSSCSLVTSLFPASCRGRAEAFARSLHRRLSSLSGETSADDDGLSQSTEATWLNSPPTIKTTEPTSSNAFRAANRAPGRQSKLSCSPETNLYYELKFELDEDAAGSPAERTDEDESSNHFMVPDFLHGRKGEDFRAAGCDPAICESTPESEESDVYFDLLSSDGEKKNETFFDPVSTSDSDASSRVNGQAGDRADPVPNQPDSDSSGSSSCALNLSCDEPVRRPALNLDSSFNTKSSTDTTSPSHESLWSDDSTLSVFEDSPDKVVDFSERTNSDIPRSLSDSQICLLATTGCASDDAQTDRSTSDTVQTPEALESNCPSLRRNKTADFGTDDDDRSSVRVERGQLVSDACASDVARFIERFADRPTETEPITNRDSAKPIGEDDCDDEHRPPRVRRCSSLKTGKTPPDTPCRKKIVRFADVLGLDLVDVRTFLDEIPKIPNSAYSDLIYDDSFRKEACIVQCEISSLIVRRDQSEPGAIGENNLKRADKTLVPLFQQPAGLSTFLDTLRKRHVCLENALLDDLATFSVQGTVRVLNLDFHKSVHVRYTLNSWNNYSDLQATYVPNSCDGLSDKFSFVIYCHTLKAGDRLEFAIRFQCKGVEYWDNNNGANYCFECFPTRPKYNSRNNKIGPTSAKEWDTLFY